MGGNKSGESAVVAGTAEELRTVVKRREDELALCRRQIETLELTRQNLAEELVAAAGKADAYERETRDVRQLQADHRELQRRHASALELMGEREEQVDELKQDLEDMKQMYQEQMSVFLAKMEASKQAGADA